jgi:hypothetical protein
MPARIMQPGEQHPEEWRGDLNPDALAGQNVGPSSAEDEKVARMAYDVKELHRRLRGFTDDQLRQIPVLARGTRLEQGATYVDLNDPDAREFTATGEMEAGRDNWYVPKSEVDYQLWNRLTGVENPDRLAPAARSQ